MVFTPQLSLSLSLSLPLYLPTSPLPPFPLPPSLSTSTPLPSHLSPCLPPTLAHLSLSLTLITLSLYHSRDSAPKATFATPNHPHLPSPALAIPHLLQTPSTLTPVLSTALPLPSYLFPCLPPPISPLPLPPSIALAPLSLSLSPSPSLYHATGDIAGSGPTALPKVDPTNILVRSCAHVRGRGCGRGRV